MYRFTRKFKKKKNHFHLTNEFEKSRLFFHFLPQNMYCIVLYTLKFFEFN